MPSYLLTFPQKAETKNRSGGFTFQSQAKNLIVRELLDLKTAGERSRNPCKWWRRQNCNHDNGPSSSSQRFSKFCEAKTGDDSESLRSNSNEFGEPNSWKWLSNPRRLRLTHLRMHRTRVGFENCRYPPTIEWNE
jgi:hypothetical protein